MSSVRIIPAEEVQQAQWDARTDFQARLRWNGDHRLPESKADKWWPATAPKEKP